MSTKIFLDLEDTIIHRWDNPVPVNVVQIKEILERYSFTDVGIFSFAIHFDTQIEKFHSKIKPIVEEALGIEVNFLVPSVEQVWKTVSHKMRMQWEMDEFMVVWGKQRGFVDWAEETFKNEHIVLLDDSVSNMTIYNHDKNLKIDLITVKEDPAWTYIPTNTYNT